MLLKHRFLFQYIPSLFVMKAIWWDRTLLRKFTVLRVRKCREIILISGKERDREGATSRMIASQAKWIPEDAIIS